MALDVKELCRLCGKKEEFYKDLKDEDNKNILKMIQEFIQIPFEEHDELPTKVCLNCEETIESFQLFVLECYNVQDILRQMLQTCEKYPIKLEDDVVINFNNFAIKSEVKHELSSEDLVNANNSDECVSGVDADDYNNDNGDDDNVTLATLKDLKQEKTTERKRITLAETGMEHLKEISDLKTGNFFKCDICRKITKTLTGMNIHKKKHKPKSERKFCCSSCDKVFTCESKLIIHERTHLPIEEKKIYSCDLCELKFTARGSVAKHRRVVHDKVHDKPHVCDVCGFAFATVSRLRRHHIVHSHDRPYACSECDKRFTVLASVAVHRRAVHDKVKPHVCDECGRACATASQLRQHRSVHRDDRPFACRVCDKRFKTHQYRKNHEVMHDDDKPCHVCSHCGKAFTRQKALKEHMHVHMGDRRVTCEWCDASYSHPYTLRKHQQLRHPDKMARTSPSQRDKDDAVPPKTDVEAI